MPAVWAVVGKRYTLQGHASCVSDRFHRKTKAKVEKQANITSFPQQDILVFQEGMAGAKFTSYARTIRSRIYVSSFIFLETGTGNCSRLSYF